MKLKHRALAIMLTLIMVLAYMPAMAFADNDFFSGNKISGGSISVGETKEVRIDSGYDYYSFSFIPSESSWYVFSSSGEDVDTFAEVYEGEDKLGEDDDSGDDNNFAYRFYAEEGVTYYLNACFYSSGTGTFDVTVDSVEEGWWVPDYRIHIGYEEGATSLTLDASSAWAYVGEEPVITYQWYRDDADFDADEYEWQELDGETSPQLEVDAELRHYKCLLIEEATETTEEVVFVVSNEDDDDDDDDGDYGFGDLPDDLDSVDEIALNEKVDVNTAEESIKTFKFVPETSGLYVYESYSSHPADPRGLIRTGDGVVVGQNDDKDGGGLDFQIVFEAEAGVAYYLQARDYDFENVSFQVKSYKFDADWHAYNNDDDYEYDGESPVSLAVNVMGNTEGLTYDWYNSDNQLIRKNGTDQQEVSEGGWIYCVVSKGSRSERVSFFVELPSAKTGNLRFRLYEDGVYANALWESIVDDYNDYEVCMAKGAVTIPSSVKFIDGKTRTVTGIGDFEDARELTSVTIPSTVRNISEGAFLNTGLKSIDVPATVQYIGDHALGYTYNYSDSGYIFTKVAGFTIFGKTGSAAQVYARANGFTFRDRAAEAAAAKEAERQGTLDKSIAKVKITKPKAAKKSVTVTWKKLNNKQIKKGKVAKYEIWVCPNKNFGPNDTIMKTVPKSKASVKIKVPKKGTYFVKVRAIKYVGKVKKVGKWSARKSIKVKK